MEILDSPVYPVTDAAAYVRVPSSTVHQWMVAKGGLIVPAGTAPTTLSFSNLVEIFVLSALRNQHKISMQSIRKAVAFVERQLRVARPLIHATFSTAGADIFVDHLGTLVNVSKNGQTAIREVMDHYLKRVEYDQDVAVRLYPFVRSAGADQPRSVVIDPEFGFGKPVVAGTGIWTSVITSRYMAGESTADLAEDYRLEPSKVEDAIRAHLREAA
ncbi:MAG: DUF433 domain-containing protein [Polyangiaceae bacterium]